MRTRIAWKYHEWDLIVHELYRTHPNAMRSGSLIGIHSQDVETAMKLVLPQERWRLSFNMASIRPQLKERFEELRNKIEADEARQRRALNNIDQQETAKTKPAIQFSEELVDHLAKEIFINLQPMLDSYIDARLNGQPRQQAQSEAVVAHHRHRLNRTPRKLRVGVIGLIPIQQHELVKTFPELDMIFVEDGNKGSEIKTKLHNCDAIFGLTAKMAHSGEGVIRSMATVCDKYHRVDGRGTSSVKRDIQLWVNSEKHAQQEREKRNKELLAA